MVEILSSNAKAERKVNGDFPISLNRNKRKLTDDPKSLRNIKMTNL